MLDLLSAAIGRTVVFKHFHRPGTYGQYQCGALSLRTGWFTHPLQCILEKSCCRKQHDYECRIYLSRCLKYGVHFCPQQLHTGRRPAVVCFGQSLLDTGHTEGLDEKDRHRDQHEGLPNRDRKRDSISAYR